MYEKKRIKGLAAALLVFTILVGCSSNNGGNNADGDTKNNNAANTSTEIRPIRELRLKATLYHGRKIRRRLLSVNISTVTGRLLTCGRISMQ